MNVLHKSLPVLAIASLALLGCPGDDTAPGDGSGDTTEGTGNTTTDNPTTDPDSTTASDPTGSTTEDEPTGSTTMGPEPGPFVFDETPPEDYVRVDRAGFPALATALGVVGADTDAYNNANPVDDAALAFGADILTLVEALHLGVPGGQVPDNTGLDDDLLTLGFVPCVPPGQPMDNCDDQAGPNVIPDTLRITVGGTPGFPNGRAPAATVMDIIFAVLLLDLSVEEITLFTDLDGDGTPGPSLNPLENDVAFPGEWPYLAPAHAME